MATFVPVNVAAFDNSCRKPKDAQVDTASKILIVASMTHLLYGWVTGLFFAVERRRKAHAHRLKPSILSSVRLVDDFGRDVRQE